MRAPRALPFAWLAFSILACSGSPAPDAGASSSLPPAPTPELPVPHARFRPFATGPEPTLKLGCDDCGLEERPPNPTCKAVPPPPELAEVVLAYPRLPAVTEPVMVVHHPDRAEYLLVERRGRLLRFDDRSDASELTEALDLRDDVDPTGDGGLVAAAFDPRFDETDQLYLSYSAVGGTVNRARVARFTSADGGRSFERDSAEVIIDFDRTDPYRMHLNADMKFGPDGYLYAGFGDGGPQWDQYWNAQNPDNFLGKILRIDVHRGERYAVPADNPFVDQGGQPEIFAMGLRNPWRFTFQPDTGKLWVGDVGLNTWEEVDLVAPGDNLGWPMREGDMCSEVGCDDDSLVRPVTQYEHEEGAAVVAGFVYRGHALPSLVGRFVYGDFIKGDVWALTDKGGQPELIARTGLHPVSFAEEPDGELLLVDFTSGRLFRLVPQSPPAGTLADTLSATGCYQPDDPREPAPGLIPFDVRVPFWSDGAIKRRFLALPDGQTVRFQSDGTLAFPVGSVLTKDFFLGDRIIETRLMMKYREGQWTGASYIWDGEGKDAHLVPDSEIVSATFDGQSWRYPDRRACLDCHNRDRGLGLEAAQLDLPRLYPESGRVAGQLQTWQRMGVLAGDIPAGPRLPRAADGASLEERARAYLHVNCAVCHTRNGPTPVDMDLRFGTLLPEMRVCQVLPREGDLGIPDARRLSPGTPQLSIISRRMRMSGPGHMPPLGPQLVDQEGADLVDAWIAGLPDCAGTPPSTH
jgi:uncharacterized repeat protein (TIGR03806 family)